MFCVCFRRGGQLIVDLQNAIRGADVLVTVGGVSLGYHEDNLKHALVTGLNAKTYFSGIEMIPQ